MILRHYTEAAKFKVDAFDLNDDGRVTRSEAKKMNANKLGTWKPTSLPY